MDTLKHLVPGLRAIFNGRQMLKDFRSLSHKDLILFALMLLATTGAFVFGQDFSTAGMISFFVGLVTVANLILIDRGRLTNYVWGLMSALTWLIISWQNHLIGDISTQLFFFVMQFIGIAVWHKSISTNKNSHDEIVAKKLSKLQVFLVITGLIIFYLIQVFVSHKLNGAQIWLDAAVLPLNIVGQILMTNGFSSQWFAWIAVNLINIVIWTNQLHAGGAGAMSMVVLQVVMTVNSIWGLYLWSNSANTGKPTSELEIS